jgi:ABC-type phosphate transport system substrate-binding protein
VSRSLVFVAAVATLAGGCGREPAKPALSGTGSTFIAPMMTRWKSEYGTRGEVTYESVGSELGLQRLDTGVFDFACTDVPLDEGQLEKARKARGEVVHIPLVLGAVVPAYNLDGVTAPLTFSGPVLADIFLGKITRWNDKALAELNPGAALPDREIAVIHRADGSGTTAIWKEEKEKKPEEQVPLFWKLCSAALLSVAAMIMVTLYNQLSTTGNQLRSDVSQLRNELSQLRTDVVPKDDYNARIEQIALRVKEIQAKDKSASVAWRERIQEQRITVADLRQQIKELDRELLSLREQLSALEQRGATPPAPSPPRGRKQ